MSNLSLVSDLIQDIDIVYASSQALKSQAYQFRFDQQRKQFPLLRSLEQVIDEKDNKASHLLIKSKSTNTVLASIRLFKHPERTLSLSHGKTDPLLAFGEPITNFELSEFSEADKLEITEDSEHYQELLLLVYLSAFTFVRLKFQKFLLSKISNQNFKTLRSKGLLFEQTSYALLENYKDAYFYSPADDGVCTHSTAWDYYQHILGELAPQLNQPDIETHNTGHLLKAQK